MKKMKRNNIFGQTPKNFFVLFLILLVVASYVLHRLTDYSRHIQTISYSLFLTKVQENEVKSVHVAGQEVQGVLKNGVRFETVVGNNPKDWELLKEHGVEFVVENLANRITIWHIIVPLFLLFLSLIIAYFVRQSRSGGGNSGGGNIFMMNKSKARMFLPSAIKERFASVAGAHEAKEELADVVDFLKNPEKYKKLGAKITRGVLLVGEPGNGKTLLARAVAGEANCPFFTTSGSDFIEVFVGVGAARVRDLFAQARNKAPSIIFIDEIDAVGRHRGTGLGGGNDEREQTLNQLLTEMDGFQTDMSNPVIVLAATNRQDVLDKALLRPGRFDKIVQVPYPDVRSRHQILEVHGKNVKAGEDVDFQRIARGTPGFTGADLANLINEAAIIASKNNQTTISMHDFEEARDKILMGKASKTIVMSERERNMTAYHEGGHTLINLLLPELTDPLHKVTIVPRGRALGVTFSLPELEKYSQSYDELVARIKVLLGGRAAEEVVFNEIGSGAQNDFVQATAIARHMVCNLGMSPALGMVAYSQDGNYKHSGATAQMIDSEVRRIIAEAYVDVLKLLRDNRDKLDKIAHILLEKETAHASEIYELLDIKPRTEHRFI